VPRREKVKKETLKGDYLGRHSDLRRSCRLFFFLSFLSPSESLKHELSEEAWLVSLEEWAMSEPEAADESESESESEESLLDFLLFLDFLDFFFLLLPPYCASCACPRRWRHYWPVGRMVSLEGSQLPRKSAHVDRATRHSGGRGDRNEVG
jgi:hypothetical protein